MKTILITGASGGIGAAIAKELASPDCSLFLHYYQNEKHIQVIKESCEKLGAKVHTIKANLSGEKGDEELLAALPPTITFDTIVHNAGTSQFGLFTDVTNQELDQMINIHLRNPVKITRALLPAMLSEKKGKIIIISSIWGLTGASCEVIYSMVKGGVNSFVKGLAKEVAPSNIQVNAIAPGAIRTAMLTQQGEDTLIELEADIPANRIGQPEDISHAVSFLESDRSSYVNGQVISVNGAWFC